MATQPNFPVNPNFQDSKFQDNQLINDCFNKQVKTKKNLTNFYRDIKHEGYNETEIVELEMKH